LAHVAAIHVHFNNNLENAKTKCPAKNSQEIYPNSIQDKRVFAGLENRRTARYRGFKSLPLRLDTKALSESQQDAISCSGNGLRLVVSGEPEDSEVAPGSNRSQTESAVLAKKWHKNEPTESGQSPPTVDEVHWTVQNGDEMSYRTMSALRCWLCCRHSDKGDSAVGKRSRGSSVARPTLLHRLGGNSSEVLAAFHLN
jgi:hypothetical protein